MSESNIEMLSNTLKIMQQGFYRVGSKKVKLKLSESEMKKASVLLPEDIRNIESQTDFACHFKLGGRCSYACVNTDSFTAAIELYKSSHFMLSKKDKPILVLNFANPVNPGGGVRRGANAQEEDLCRKSSLLLSLESKNASAYYEYNRNREDYMGSDAMIFTPNVEIIRDANGELLVDSVEVAVLTCAAPLLIKGKRGLSEAEYRDVVYNRIMGMLKCAAYFGYGWLVLGAWGCGAFGNDARVISDLFCKALKDMEFNGMHQKDFFNKIVFAVLDRTEEQYNFKEFYRNFSNDNFYKSENQAITDAVLQKIRENEKYLDKIRGCLIGGAAGDALGYPVEFLGESEIFSLYGNGGIRDYRLDASCQKALISDDTQMTLFTANGILFGKTRGSMRGIGAPVQDYIKMSYQDWLITQEMSFEESRKCPKGYMKGFVSWLADVPELYADRAPGNTCLEALRRLKNENSYRQSFINPPQNDSKGCGGIMRVAPIGLQNNGEISWNELERLKNRDMTAAETAAITHGHSLGYMSAAVLVHIIARIVYSPTEKSLKKIILEARDTVSDLFPKDAHLKELTRIIDLAVKLSENKEDDLYNINQIGEGWVAEETLGIAIYCSLRHQDDFSAGITAAVNHKGDSDSTGAVTGNILGALLGYDAIDPKWKTKLELADVILEMADDLCHDCQMSEYSFYIDPDWVRKYIYASWKEETEKV